MKTTIKRNCRALAPIAFVCIALLGFLTHSTIAAPGDLYVPDTVVGVPDAWFVYKFTPNATESTFATISSHSTQGPLGLAFDRTGNLFVSDVGIGGDGDGLIVKITPAGEQSVFATGLSFPVGLAFDSSGNLYEADNPSSGSDGSIFKFTPDGCKSTFASGLAWPRGLAFDRNGNLYVGDIGDDVDGHGTIFVFTPDGQTRTTFATGINRPRGLAFDSAGNLYVVERNTHDILKFSPSGEQSTFVTGIGVSIGLALDAASNLYVAETNNADIRKITPDGTGSIFIPPQPDSSLYQPTWLAFEPNTVVRTTSEIVSIGTVGSGNTTINLTFPNVQTGGTTMATPIDPISGGTLPAGFAALGTDANNLTQGFEIATTATTDTSTTPITIAFQVPLPPGPDVSTLSVFHNQGGELVDVTSSRDEMTNTIYAHVTSLSPFVIAKQCRISTSIGANFNGTAITSGNYIWFSSVLKPAGLGSDPVTIHFTQQMITSANFTFSVPDAMVTFDPKATSATTTFSNGTWVTRVPSSGLAGNTFLSGFSYQLPQNLPGGIKNVMWSGVMNSDTPGVSAQWKCAAAVYTSFNSNYNAVGVKPVDDNKASQYKNSDHAGTPENFKSYVTGGATGGGGSNYTGGYSGTAAVGPCP